MTVTEESGVIRQKLYTAPLFAWRPVLPFKNSMRILGLIYLAIASGWTISPQSPSSTMSELRNNPRGMLAAALPQYDFGGTSMKPWHMKGAYQLYDESGNPTQQGTYEYWQESPKVYRSSWNRTDATRTEWHTLDGKPVYKATGERLFYFEHELETLLFSPVPDPATLDSVGLELNRDQLETGKVKLPCAEIKARTRSNGTTPILVGVAEGQYCFDPTVPVLRIEHLFNSVYVAFNKLTRIQNRILAQEITITDGLHKLLVFNAGEEDELPNGNAIASPPADAIHALTERHSSPSEGLLLKKVPPVYPPLAKAAHINGVVVLDIIIGKDGRVKDIRVLKTSSPLLTSASKDAVAQWVYAPFIQDGQSQEVNTIVNVVFFT